MKSWLDDPTTRRIVVRHESLVAAHMDVEDAFAIGQSFEYLAEALAAGYCRRNPSCGD